MQLRRRRQRRSKLLRHGLVLMAVMVFSLASPAGEWRTHEPFLNGYRNQINKLESEIKELIENKNHTKNRDEKRVIMSEMVAKHKELKEAAMNLRSELLHIRFKHPDKGDMAERKYTRFQVKSLEQMEAEVGLDGKLEMAKQKMQSQYGVGPSKADKLKEQDNERAPASLPQAKPASDRIILKK